ncbi:hypothetical protein OKW45_007551 [Paraburkholderia sp. WSM4175]
MRAARHFRDAVADALTASAAPAPADMQISATLELFAKETSRQYAAMCGWVLARAHAKAGGLATEVAACLGNGDQMTEALILYSRAYADQVEKDYEVFRHACRSGKLEARTDSDMAADFVAWTSEARGCHRRPVVQAPSASPTTPNSAVVFT